MKNTVLKMFVPLIERVRSSARAKAIILIVITETTVNFTVNQRALTKSSFENALI